MCKFAASSVAVPSQINSLSVGAFTNEERKLLEEWITKLGSHQIKPIASSVYYNFAATPAYQRFPPPNRQAATLADITQHPSIP